MHQTDWILITATSGMLNQWGINTNGDLGKTIHFAIYWQHYFTAFSIAAFVSAHDKLNLSFVSILEIRCFLVGMHQSIGDQRYSVDICIGKQSRTGHIAIPDLKDISWLLINIHVKQFCSP